MLASLGLVFLLHIIHMAVDLGGWADGNLILLYLTMFTASQVANSTLIVLSPRWYWAWKKMKWVRFTFWILALVTVTVFLGILIEHIVMIIAGHTPFDDIMKILNATWMIMLSPSALASIFTIVLEVLSGDMDPNDMGKYTHASYGPHMIDLTPTDSIYGGEIAPHKTNLTPVDKDGHISAGPSHSSSSKKLTNFLVDL